MSVSCEGCGAQVALRVCHFCGTAAAPLRSSEDESKAIAELHRVIAETKDDATRARLLKNGPIPAAPDALVEAGVWVAQLLDPERYTDDTPPAAIARLQAICMKLRIVSGADGAPRRAAEEFEQRIERYRADAAKESRAGLRALFIFLVVVAAGVVGVKLLFF